MRRRSISLFLRTRAAKKDIRATLKRFDEWQKDIDMLPPAAANDKKKLLLIRLDDIGDYILWRNTLPAYKLGQRWRGYEITMLGNAAWKPLYDKLDAGSADNVIWINKAQYMDSAQQRQELWSRLRGEGFDTVICPSRTRPMLLDDTCMLAARAGTAMGGANTLPQEALNNLSDSLYKTLYRDKEPVHEFIYNQRFANWCCHTLLAATRPVVAINSLPAARPYLLCFASASKKSKQWPPVRWKA